MRPRDYVQLQPTSGPSRHPSAELNDSMVHSLERHADERFSDGAFSIELAEESEGHALRNGLIGVALMGIGVVMEVVVAAGVFYGFTPLEGAAVAAVAGVPVVIAGGASIRSALYHGRAASQELDRAQQTIASTDAMIKATNRYRD